MNKVCGFLIAIAQICVTQHSKLEGHDSQPGDRFGVSVDMIQNRIIVGADRNFPLTSSVRTGAVYVFEFVGGKWMQQAQLTPSNTPIKGEFGWSVSCDTSRVAVGAPKAYPTSVPNASGLIYVYTKQGSTWLEAAVLDPQDPLVADEFGWAVDLDNDSLLVGAPTSDPAGAGATYVYVGGPSSWTQQARLMASDPKSSSLFGYSGVLSGDTVVVGAPRADGAVADSGAVYVFMRNGSSWTQAQKIVASDGGPQDWFGVSVRTEGSTLVVGAYLDDSGAWTDHGSAYVFGWDGQKWVEQQKLTPKGYAPLDYAGFTVALDGDKLILGAPNEFQTPGSIHLYTRSATGWLPQLKVNSSDGWCPPGVPCIHPGLGRAAWLEGSSLVAGAPMAAGASLPQTGAVYVFELQAALNPQPTFYCLAKQDSKGCVPRFFHSGVPSVSGASSGQPFQVAAWEVLPKVPGMLYYSTTGAASRPFAGGFLCIQGPIRATQMALTVENGMPHPCNGHFNYDFNSWIASGSDPSLTAGQPIWMQYWYRDPTGGPSTNAGLTDGVFLVVCP